MPPKSKFKKEQIVQAAVEVVERIGYDGLTARTLAAALGSSPRPIFTVFAGMDEVCAAVTDTAKSIYAEYAERGLTGEPAFKGAGMAYIRFAAERPRLFSLLFMREQKTVPPVGEVLASIDDNSARILQSIIDGYGVSKAQAERLYRHLWLYTHGIAVAVATKLCSFTVEQIADMLTDVFVPLLRSVKAEGTKV